jgi:hypothetical protein
MAFKSEEYESYALREPYNYDFFTFFFKSLDKYAIVCIFYVCCLSVWHSIVGSFWPKEEACQIDKWVLLGFSVVFILIHVGLVVWFIRARNEIRIIREKERLFIEKLRRLARLNNQD